MCIRDRYWIYHQLHCRLQLAVPGDQHLSKALSPWGYGSCEQAFAGSRCLCVQSGRRCKCPPVGDLSGKHRVRLGLRANPNRWTWPLPALGETSASSMTKCSPEKVAGVSLHQPRSVSTSSSCQPNRCFRTSRAVRIRRVANRDPTRRDEIDEVTRDITSITPLLFTAIAAQAVRSA